MSVRSKLSLATGLVLLSLLAGLYFGGRLIVVDTLKREERDAVLRAMPLLKNSLMREYDYLESIASDRALRDETRRYIQDRDSEYVRQNFGRDAFGLLGIHLLVVTDASGHMLEGRFLSPADGRLQSVNRSIEMHLRPGLPLMRFDGVATKGNRGILMLDEGPMLVAVQPVSDAAGKAAHTGVVVAGRLLRTQDVTSFLSAMMPAFPAQGSLGLRMYEDRRDNPLAAPFSEWRTLGDQEVAVEEIGDDLLRASLPLRDVYNRSAVTIVATIPRTFSKVAERTLTYLSALITGMGLLFEVLLFMLQSHVVLNPLTSIARFIHDLGPDPAGKRLRWKRRDEFGLVAAEFDRQLEAIERDHAAIVESEHRNRALLRANPDAMYVFNRDGRCADAKVEDAAGLVRPAGELVGRHIEEVLPGREIAKRFLAGIGEAIQTGKVHIMEYEYRRPDGSVFWGEARMVRMNSSQALAIVRNITEQKQSAEDRSRWEVKMRQLQNLESLRAMSEGIAHDFNNIFMGILGYAELAEARLPADSSSRALLGNIRTSVLRAAELARQMQAYAGHGGGAFKPLDLNHLLGEMVHLFQSSIPRYITLTFHFHPDLPLIEGDSSQVWQAAMNLLVNASESIGDKPGSISVNTRRTRLDRAQLVDFLSGTPLNAGEYALLEVSDTGCGMDAATVERIFDPFFSTKAPGRGLGLSAAFGIMRGHGGGIAVHTRPSEGSVFSLIFPVLAAKPSIVDPTVVSGVTSTRRLVLIAEDDPDVRKIAGLILKTGGYESLTAENGRLAVELFKQSAADIGYVLMDVEMPEMNGVEAFQAIRAIRRDVPIIIMSGYGDSASRERFNLLDPAAFLSKPFTGNELLAVLAGIAVHDEPKG